MGRRADQKKQTKHISIGTRVTWGNGSLSHKVLEVQHTGVVVDVSDDPEARLYTVKNKLGRYTLFVRFDKGIRIAK